MKAVFNDTKVWELRGEDEVCPLSSYAIALQHCAISNIVLVTYAIGLSQFAIDIRCRPTTVCYQPTT